MRKSEASGSVWKVTPQRVKAPYAKPDEALRYPE